MHREWLEDDIKLVEACINKDLLAWSAFIKKYSGLISISIVNRLKRYGLLLPREDIEDIKQDVLSSIWKDKKLETVKNRANICYWLSIVSGNTAIEYARRRRSLEPIKPMSLFEKMDEKEISEIIPSHKNVPTEEVSKDEISNKIDKALELLPSKERLIIKLNLIYDKKYDEIADMLNLPKGTVSSYIKRAKEKLKEALRDFR